MARKKKISAHQKKEKKMEVSGMKPKEEKKIKLFRMILRVVDSVKAFFGMIRRVVDSVRAFFGMIRRVVDSVKAYFGKPYLTWDSFGNFTNVSSFIMTHLTQMYFSLFLILLSSFLGSIWDFFKQTGGLGTTFGFIGFLIWFRFVRPWKERQRVALLMTAAFFNGASLEYLLSFLTSVYKGIAITILGVGVITLGCFAVVARRYEIERDYTYAYGVQYAIIIAAIWLFNAVYMFSGGTAFAPYFFLPFVGFAYLVSYTVLFSQEIVEQARRGSSYYSDHCLMFFTDLPCLTIWFLCSLKKEVSTHFR